MATDEGQKFEGIQLKKTVGELIGEAHREITNAEHTAAEAKALVAYVVPRIAELERYARLGRAFSLWRKGIMNSEEFEELAGEYIESLDTVGDT